MFRSSPASTLLFSSNLAGNWLFSTLSHSPYFLLLDWSLFPTWFAFWLKYFPFSTGLVIVPIGLSYLLKKTLLWLLVLAVVWKGQFMSSKYQFKVWDYFFILKSWFAMLIMSLFWNWCTSLRWCDWTVRWFLRHQRNWQCCRGRWRNLFIGGGHAVLGPFTLIVFGLVRDGDEVGRIVGDLAYLRLL